jgi:hypothetical protein
VVIQDIGGRSGYWLVSQDIGLLQGRWIRLVLDSKTGIGKGKKRKLTDTGFFFRVS